MEVDVFFQDDNIFNVSHNYTHWQATAGMCGHTAISPRHWTWHLASISLRRHPFYMPVEGDWVWLTAVSLVPYTCLCHISPPYKIFKGTNNTSQFSVKEWNICRVRYDVTTHGMCHRWRIGEWLVSYEQSLPHAPSISHSLAVKRCVHIGVTYQEDFQGDVMLKTSRYSLIHIYLHARRICDQ